MNVYLKKTVQTVARKVLALMLTLGGLTTSSWALTILNPNVQTGYSAAPVSNAIYIVDTREEFAQLLAQSKALIAYVFDRHSTRIEDMFRDMQSSNLAPGVTVVFVNIANPYLTPIIDEYQIDVIPSILFFQNNTLIDRLVHREINSENIFIVLEQYFGPYIIEVISQNPQFYVFYGANFRRPRWWSYGWSPPWWTADPWYWRQSPYVRSRYSPRWRAPYKPHWTGKSNYHPRRSGTTWKQPAWQGWQQQSTTQPVVGTQIQQRSGETVSQTSQTPQRPEIANQFQRPARVRTDWNARAARVRQSSSATLPTARPLITQPVVDTRPQQRRAIELPQRPARAETSRATRLERAQQSSPVTVRPRDEIEQTVRMKKN